MAQAVMENYIAIAQAGYEDSLALARALHQHILEFVADPTEEWLDTVRQAWRDARVPYQQTEVFRFGNEIVDAWEGRVNAWPIDEGFLDYVDTEAYGAASDENPAFAANLIASDMITIDGREVDVSRLDSGLLAQVLHEAGGIETNIATGYHVIEFLLWGQDLNKADQRMSPGQRPASDYSRQQCTGGSCQRRAELLRAVSALLVDDLAEMARAWAPGGAARAGLSGDTIYRASLFGIVSLAFGELAGERMRVGLELHDQEEEHDCFSDNTHNSHFYNVVGIENIYLGRYRRVDGSLVEGPGLADAVKARDQELDALMRARVSEARAAVAALVESHVEDGNPYDWLLDESNPEGNALIQAGIDSLASLAETGESVSSLLAR